MISHITPAFVPYLSYPARPDVREPAREVASASGAAADSGKDGARLDQTRNAPRGQDGQPLSQAEQRELRRLQQRDAEVRAHEAAHVAAGGSLVTQGASYTYTRGPDGRPYAVGGEVSISTSEGRSPEETLQRAEQIRRAALAPADPSAQDRQVAAQAAQMAMEARSAIAAAQQDDSPLRRPDAAYRQPAEPVSGARLDVYA